jgi:hypothetical protein
MSDTLKRYKLTIQRNQIAEVEIEVEADNQDQAEELALKQAEDCDVKFEEVDYNFEIIHIESEEFEDEVE